MARRNTARSPLSLPALTRSACAALVAAAAVVAIAFAYPLPSTDLVAVVTADGGRGDVKRADQLKTEPLALPAARPPPPVKTPEPRAVAAPPSPTTAPAVAPDVPPKPVPNVAVPDVAAPSAALAPPVAVVDPQIVDPQTAAGADAAPTGSGEVDLALVVKPSPAGWRTTSVEPGDTLSSIFGRLSTKPEDLHSLYLLIEADSNAKALERLRPGQTVKIHTDADGQLLELVYQPNQLRGLEVKRRGDGFDVKKIEHPLQTRTAHAAGVVDSSLYGAAKKAGLSDKLIVKFSDIFGWKIDFSHDVAPGDTFVVVFEEKTLDGERVDTGAILAAEYVNRNKTYRAIGVAGERNRMEYYTPEGKSLKQAFMRNPVAFHRISSHFQPNRFHPVLGKRRPHRGVDYAAPTGTPIRSSGDGRVKSIKRGRGYGRVIEIDHGNGYTTLYAHMSRFNKKLRVGSPVAQGDVIGYVGSSGLATGPHLHYEFRINGKHQNPMTVKLPGKHIDAKLSAAFQQTAARYVAELDRHAPTRVAANSD